MGNSKIITARIRIIYRLQADRSRAAAAFFIGRHFEKSGDAALAKDFFKKGQEASSNVSWNMRKLRDNLQELERSYVRPVSPPPSLKPRRAMTKEERRDDRIQYQQDEITALVYGLQALGTREELDDDVTTILREARAYANQQRADRLASRHQFLTEEW